jgi:hypothetical protein
MISIKDIKYGDTELNKLSFLFQLLSTSATQITN